MGWASGQRLLKMGILNKDAADLSDYIVNARPITRRAYCSSYDCRKQRDIDQKVVMRFNRVWEAEVEKKGVTMTDVHCKDCGHVLFWECSRIPNL